ncbi:MAG: radical SAM protein [Syntrophaceae bacterium]|nr:radical SAM protein [Syntrophaceae bacterium]
MMKVKPKIKKVAWGKVVDLVAQIVDAGPVRKFLIKKADKKLWQGIVEEDQMGLRPAQELKYAFVRNLLYTTDKHLRRGIMSKEVFHKMVKVFVRNVFVEDISERDIRREERKDAVYPCYLVLSPTGLCNLHCPGCYASSSSHTNRSLPYSIVSRIVREKKEFWHSRFTVISGGEPFLWQSDGKGIIDLAREHDDNFFMVYTNGTLINEEVARQLADVGNLTPCISVEGFEEKTDRRRGRGIFRRIMKTFEDLRKEGVPFGISVEATRDNWDEVTSKEFLKFYFDEQGAFYGWLFQYMPIGRNYTLEEMVTPEQRLEMFTRNVWAIKEGGYNYIDFWNQGVMTDGCLAAGRNGGYLYIDWNGNVMPCVFIPYFVDNIYEVYKRGGNLNDVICSTFFREIRRWQSQYAYGKPPTEQDNLILPCPIRDHHKDLYKILKSHSAIQPSDEAAREAKEDPLYHENLVSYDQLLRQVIDPVWEREYKKCA